MWDDTTASDGCLDQSVEFLVTSDGQLKMSWSNSLDFQIFRSVTCEFQDLSGEVLEDSSTVDC